MDDIRYGIFLRPDPATCWAVTQVTLALRQQFGIVAGAAFAPHATLIGNLRIDGTGDGLICALDRVFSDAHPIPVYNHGIVASGNGVRYDIDRDASGSQRNVELVAVADAVRAAVEPLHIRHDDLLAPNVQDYRFTAHLTLAGFDLDIDPRLSREVVEFVQGLPVACPSSFVARWYTLFEFRGDWTGQWWHHMNSRHLRSWEVR